MLPKIIFLESTIILVKAGHWSRNRSDDSGVQRRFFLSNSGLRKKFKILIKFFEIYAQLTAIKEIDRIKGCSNVFDVISKYLLVAHNSNNGQKTFFGPKIYLKSSLKDGKIKKKYYF